MLASLSGSLALAVGLAVMLLPLLSPELSRPRDAAWGAVVLVLGLTLVTSADRLTGSPMLAVLCGGLLIGRLGGEVDKVFRERSTRRELGVLAKPIEGSGDLGTFEEAGIAAHADGDERGAQRFFEEC